MEQHLSETSVTDQNKESLEYGNENLKSQKVLEAFEKGHLLARAVDRPSLKRTDQGPALDWEIVDREVGYMEEGLFKNVSSTYIEKGLRIPTYKAVGFLMDASISTLLHVSEIDSSSSVANDGTLFARGKDLKTLEELSKVIKAGYQGEMNEVNAHFPKGALLGLFAVEAPSPVNRIAALAMQKRLKEQQLPVFIYNAADGSLTEYTPTTEEIRALFDDEKTPRLYRQVYARALLFDPDTETHMVSEHFKSDIEKTLL